MLAGRYSVLMVLVSSYSVKEWYETIILTLIFLEGLVTSGLEYLIFRFYRRYFEEREKEIERRREQARKAGVASGVARRKNDSDATPKLVDEG